MLSSVFNSPRDAARHLQPQHTRSTQQVFEAIRELMTPPESPRRPIGFVTPEEKSKTTKAKRSTA